MPQDSTLPVGETVDVRIRGAVVQQPAPLVVKAGTEDIVVPTDAEVTVANPANWPPQQGDVWKDGSDTLWFALIVLVQNEPRVRLVAETGGTPANPQQVKTDHRPLTLAYRSA